jgi:hypothetical protein
MIELKLKNFWVIFLSSFDLLACIRRACAVAYARIVVENSIMKARCRSIAGCEYSVKIYRDYKTKA